MQPFYRLNLTVGSFLFIVNAYRCEILRNVTEHTSKSFETTDFFVTFNEINLRALFSVAHRIRITKPTEV